MRTRRIEIGQGEPANHSPASPRLGRPSRIGTTITQAPTMTIAISSGPRARPIITDARATAGSDGLGMGT